MDIDVPFVLLYVVWSFIGSRSLVVIAAKHVLFLVQYLLYLKIELHLIQIVGTLRL